MDKRYILILGGEFSLRERVLAGALRAAGGMQVLTMAKNRTSAAIKFLTAICQVMSPMKTPYWMR
ncbi:hypothetical protein WDV93_07220 [Pantoea ananatis]